MKITFGKEGLKESWQEDFPETTDCCRCKGVARIGFIAHENDEVKYLCDLYPNKGKGGYWLHDACAVAVYFCKKCLQPTALYNQA